MKLFVSLCCCFAVAAAASAEPQGNQRKKKTSPQPTPQAQQPVRPKGRQPYNASQLQSQQNMVKPKSHNLPAVQSNAQAFRPRHFNLANRPNRSIPNVTFRANNRIQGSERWQGQNYAAFRSYRSQWHDRGWWQSHHNRIVFVFGGPYYWDADYWYPAWGYAPNAYYAYDGPIYAGSADMDPGQVVANVQSALQAQGYYTGEVDGILGPLTRAAIAKYQQDHGLVITSAVDEPTLASLGMA
jgi:hypothetical protein